MRPVIVGITLQNPTQVRLAKDDDVIKALAPDRSDQPFCEAILPDAHCTNAAQGELAIDAIVISDEVARRLIPGECLRELARKPFCSRILCHVNPEQLSPVQPDYDEGIKQAEPDGRDYEQIHGCDVRGRGYAERCAIPDWTVPIA
jgi:hypothetical protein